VIQVPILRGHDLNDVYVCFNLRTQRELDTRTMISSRPGKTNVKKERHLFMNNRNENIQCIDFF
jgi:hypothetical protein